MSTWRLYLLLPPRSRLRQAISRRYLKLGFEAVNRRDFEAAFLLYHPDGESIFDERAIALGFERVYRGREARIEAQGDGSFLFRLSAGRVVHEQLFLDRNEALEAVGLSKEQVA